MFNEVFLDRRAHPGREPRRRGERGLALAKVTLGNERVSLSGGGALWGMGPTAADLFDLVTQPAAASPTRRCASAGGAALHRVRDPAPHPAAHRDRGDQGRAARPRGVGAQGARRRARPAHHGARQGPRRRPRDARADDATASRLRGRAAGRPGIWHYGYLFAPALTIGGGTGEVQRNIIAERVLGLPHDIDVETGKTWRESAICLTGTRSPPAWDALRVGVGR